MTPNSSERTRMDALEFEIPVRTISETNQRCHWAVKAKRAKEQRVMSDMFTRQWLDDLPQRPWKITLTRIGKRRMDPGNVPPAMKAAQDGICDALGIDDDGVEHEWAYRQSVEKRYAVGVKIEPLTAN